MKIPKLNWIPFDKNNPPADLYNDVLYLVVLREDNYDNGATWKYSIDVAEPYGSYIDNFWDTTNDWREGQLVEVLYYADMPCTVEESDLVEVE